MFQGQEKNVRCDEPSGWVKLPSNHIPKHYTWTKVTDNKLKILFLDLF